MPKGTIIKIMDRGFGFIKPEQGEDLFFHSNDVEGVEFNSLSEGQEVEFEKGQGREGRPKAINVKLAEAKTEAKAETKAETPVEDSGDDKDDDDKSGDDKGGDGGGDTG